jgi:hypothetical protein
MIHRLSYSTFHIKTFEIPTLFVEQNRQMLSRNFPQKAILIPALVERTTLNVNADS